MDLEGVKLRYAFASMVAIIATIIVFLPIIVGYQNSPEGMEFMGIVTNVGDANTYFDYLNQAKDGHFLLRNSYTQEDTGYKMIRPLFWLMGVVPLPIMWSWHIFKIILIFGFVFVAQQFIRYFVQDDFLERIALVVMTFGTGLGWYVHMLNPLLPKSYGSIDLGLTEAFPFLSLHSAPHFIFSQILVMLAMYLFYRGVVDQNMKLSMLAGVSGFLLGFEHIYNMIPIYATVGMFFLFRVVMMRKDWQKEIVHYIVFGLVSCGSFLYYAYIFLFDPVFSSWTDQNELLSPPVSNLIFGYGILLPLILITGLLVIGELFRRGFAKHYLEKHQAKIFLLLWTGISFVLLYMPFSFQRRFVEVLFFPMVVLAVLALAHTLKRAPRYRMAVVTGVALLCIPTSVFMWTDYFVLEDNAQTYFPVPYYLSDEELEVLEWLRDNADAKDTVLASVELSNYVPRLSLSKVYAGHWAQTVNFDEKKSVYEGLGVGGCMPDNITFLIRAKGVEYATCDEKLPVVAYPGFSNDAYVVERLG